jgi:WD40 repeat protein
MLILCRIRISFVQLLVLLAATLVATEGAVALDKSPIEVVPQIGHSWPVNSVAFSSDGRTILSGGLDGLRLWDTATSRILRIVGDRSEVTTSVAYAPDGRTVLSGGGAGMLKLWDAATGKLLQTLGGQLGHVNSVAFSPDSRTVLACTSGGTVNLWDAVTGRLLLSWQLNTETSVAFSPDGRTVLSGGSDRPLRLWDIATGKLLRTFQRHANDSSVTPDAVAFSPDGRTALSGGSDRPLRLWDVATGTLVRTFEGHLNHVGSVAFSPDGRTALSGGNAPGAAQLRNENTDLKLWDTATGKLLRTFKGRSYDVSSAALSPDGRTILSGGRNHTVNLWDAVTGRLVQTFRGHSEVVTSVAFSPDGGTLLSGSKDNTFKLWDVATGKLLRSVDGPRPQVPPWFSAPPPFPVPGQNEYGSMAVAFSPDGRTILSGSSKDFAFRLWDAATGKLLLTFQGRERVLDLAFSPNGDAVLSAGGFLQLWNTATGKLLRTFQGVEAVQSAAFSPDGRTVVSANFDKTIKLWDVATGKLLRTFQNSSSPVSVKFSPDGRTILSGDRGKTLKLWDAATGEVLRTFQGHLDAVISVAFSRDGRTAFSGGDTSLMLWSVSSGQPLLRLLAAPSGKAAEWLAITRDGFFDASAVDIELLSVVRGVKPTGVDQIYQSLFNPDLVREASAGDPDHEVEKAAKELNLETVLDSGVPPLASFASPEQGASVNADVLNAEGTISDEGGGIGRIEWRVNGLTVGVEYPPQGVSKSYSLSRVLPLEEGENEISLVAYNGKNLMASIAAKTTVTSTAAKDAKAGRLHVIVFGLNDYEKTGLPNLHYAVPDALAIGKALKEAGKGLYSSVTVTGVLDPGVVPSKELDRVFAATSSGLEKAFEAVAQEADVHDTFVFFAAGHGTAVNGRFHLLGQDYYSEGDTDVSIKSHGIGQEKLQAWIANIKAKRGLILLDSCESGAAVIGASRNDADAALGKLHEATGRFVITAANVSQAALEGYEGHGVFSSAILDALVNGDANKNGTIEVSEIADWVQAKVPELSKVLREKGDRGIALGYAAHGFAERMAIPAKADQLLPQAVPSQKPKTGSRGEDFSLVNKWATGR